MDNHKIIALMEEAKQESLDIGVKLLAMEKLQQRKTQLESLIAQCEALLDKPSQEPPTEFLFKPPQTEPIKYIRPKKKNDKSTNWEKAKLILADTGNKPLTLSEFVEEFRKRGFKLSDDNPKAVVRAAMRSRPDIFAYKKQKDGDAYIYWLKDFPVTKSSTAEQQ